MNSNRAIINITKSKRREMIEMRYELRTYVKSLQEAFGSPKYLVIDKKKQCMGVVTYYGNGNYEDGNFGYYAKRYLSTIKKKNDKNELNIIGIYDFKNIHMVSYALFAEGTKYEVSKDNVSFHDVVESTMEEMPLVTEADNYEEILEFIKNENDEVK